MLVAAYRALGVPPGAERMQKARAWLERMVVREPDGSAWMSGFAGDVWGTGFAISSLVGSAFHTTIRRS
jgi:hypothetical protein